MELGRKTVVKPGAGQSGPWRGSPYKFLNWSLANVTRFVTGDTGGEVTAAH